MNAVQKPRVPPVQRSRVLPLHAQSRQRYPYAATFVETLLKLLVNGTISVAAIAALGTLIPHLQSHQAKLREIRVQVKESEIKVNQLQDKFTRSFDPGKAKTVMQEQSARVDPNQRRVVWVNKGTPRERVLNSSATPNALLDTDRD